MVHIYQIYYDQKSRDKVHQPFIPWNNSNPTDKTWYEYSAIRNILLSESFKESDYIGIFSPRFYEKTGMKPKDVLDIIDKSNHEVISFSPNISQSCLYINSFYQGEIYHPGLMDIGQSLSDRLNIGIDIRSLWQDQTRIIFSNYFVAKFCFWRKWLEVAEGLYDVSNNTLTALSGRLNTFSSHRCYSDKYQFKIFLMERIVSLVLEKYAQNAQIGLNYKQYLMQNRKDRKYINAYLTLDEIKSKYIKTKNKYYLCRYENYRKQIIKKQMLKRALAKLSAYPKMLTS